MQQPCTVSGGIWWNFALEFHQHSSYPFHLWLDQIIVHVLVSCWELLNVSVVSTWYSRKSPVFSLMDYRVWVLCFLLIIGAWNSGLGVSVMPQAAAPGDEVNAFVGEGGLSSQVCWRGRGLALGCSWRCFLCPGLVEGFNLSQVW